MTARHRDSPSPAQARLRLLVVVMLVGLVVGNIFFRGSPDEGPDGTQPTAGGSTTATSSPDDPGSTAGSGTAPTTLPGSSLAPLEEVTLELVYDGLRQPVVLTAPEGDDRLFVTQRVGVIRILDETRQLLDPAFLDITDRVLAGGIEQGLLGMAFHPDYANNGRFFVYYTDKGGNRQLSEFRVAATDPDRAIADSEKVLFEYEQPPNATDIRHYGGNVRFDANGLLWVSLGDGADSRAQAQDPNTPYGKIVRIDVDGGDPYSIPADNPFVDGGGKAEVWAYGLRNPWRFSIDPVDNLIYIADVGHADQEEVNVVPIDEGGGYNFGWSDMEGTRCFHKQDCNPDDYTSPVITYTHEDGLSITGGFVYRGDEIPELDGIYFYSDWVGEWIKSFTYVDGQATDLKDWTEDLGGPVGQINSFGLDGHGELYVVTHGGQVYKFTAVR
ncbi:MAG: PQQ-dependent sugar dehydrogenase [Acidimicrobiia bacterium]